ncbi:hypothetical protein R3P38DRAFT_3577149 [Favolaschia claudopus]|uniref:Uncharacterized protein n=1 Tax=Favolaschia claudopus TaxID=2862362 RepID=A0AAW0DPS8_9AGAR
MTNEPSGNYLVSSIIGSDGKLTLYEAVRTGGVGAHGLPAPPGTDPLFSQGAVVVSPAKRFVANVNVRLLWPIGRPVSSGGEFPNSLVINKAGNRVCAVNGGKVNGVSCYHFDYLFGLTPIKNSIRSLELNQTTPATGPPNTPSQILFSQDEKKLIVSVKAGYLAVWDINADGSLSKTFSKVAGGALPFSMNHIPGKNALFTSDPGAGYNIFNLDQSSGKSAATASSFPIPGAKAPCWSVYSKETKNFYVLDPGASAITEVSLTSSLDSTIVKQYDVTPDGPIDSDVATVGGKDFIFALAANVTGLSVYAVNGAGQGSVHQRLDLVGSAKAAKLPINRVNVQGMATFIGR